MINRELTIVAPGVTREEYPFHFYLRGSKEALIASGLADEDWFVGANELDGHGRKKRQKKSVMNGLLITTLVPAKGPAQICIESTEEKQEAMRSQLDAQKAARDSSERQVQQQYRHYVSELTHRLRQRYPNVRVMDIYVRTMDDGSVQQAVHYQATREVLLASGLASEQMFVDSNAMGKTTELGCGYSLARSGGNRWNFWIYTGETPRDHRLTKKGLRETSKLLRQIFATQGADGTCG